MNQGIQNSMKIVNINVDQMQVFVITNNVGTKIKANVNAKNLLIKAYAIKDLLGIQVIANVIVIILVILVSIQTMKILNRKKIVDKLVKECSGNKIEVAKITLAVNEYKYKCSSSTLHIVLFSKNFTINVGIGAYFVYYKYMNCNKETDQKKKFIFQAKFFRHNL